MIRQITTNQQWYKNTWTYIISKNVIYECGSLTSNSRRLVNKRKNEYENKQFTKLAVGAWDSYFNRSILKSPAIELVFFWLSNVHNKSSKAPMKLSMLVSGGLYTQPMTIVTNGGGQICPDPTLWYFIFFRLPRISRKSSDTDTV